MKSKTVPNFHFIYVSFSCIFQVSDINRKCCWCGESALCEKHSNPFTSKMSPKSDTCRNISTTKWYFERYFSEVGVINRCQFFFLIIHTLANFSLSFQSICVLMIQIGKWRTWNFEKELHRTSHAQRHQLSPLPNIRPKQSCLFPVNWP